jgi:putative acetyltransferase
MSGTATSVTRVDVDHGSLLEGLLAEYHAWMETMVGRETGASYDADANVADDLRDVLGSGTDCLGWLAFRDDDLAGCAFLYGVADDVAELKRLYVRPAHRSHGIGRGLTETLGCVAFKRGYATLALTTPPWSDAAHALYDSLGFERTGPYPETRLPEQYHNDAIFMQLNLADRGD